MSDDDLDEVLRARHSAFVADLAAVLPPARLPVAGPPPVSRMTVLSTWAGSRLAVLVRWLPVAGIARTAGAFCGLLVTMALLISSSTHHQNAEVSVSDPGSDLTSSPWPGISSSQTSGAADYNLVLDTTVNNTIVNFSVSVNPTGRPATVEVTTNHGFAQTFTTGVGGWTWWGSQDVGYLANVTVTVTVWDTGRQVLRQTQSRITPPPPPSVTVSKGAECGRTACRDTGCAAPTCAFVVVQTANFTGNVTCTFHDDHGATGFVNESFGANERRQTRNYFGYQGERVYVTCGGVQGSLVW